MGETSKAVRRDKCAELGDSINYYKWPEWDKEYIEKIRSMTFDYLGATDQTKVMELLEELHGSH